MRLRRFAALSMVAACGLSLTSSGVGASETPAGGEVIANVVAAPALPVVAPVPDAADSDPAAAADLDAPAVVDVNVAPDGDAANSATDPQPASVAAAQPESENGTPLDFGTPPSGVVPILFNDHHIYAKPDELRRGRLLAALVKNGQIMVPLRSLFEALGASVTYDPNTRVISLRKRGVDVTLTVGKPSIVLDGEVRPLDVPPEIHDGIVLLPVRVCSEVFGAYVQYVPQLRVVAIRYLAPTAPVPAPPSTPPPVVATAPPVSGPPRVVPPGAPLPKLPPGLETLVVADTMVSPQVFNEFADDARGPVGQNYQLRGATEFDFLGGGFELDASYRQERYSHTSLLPVALIGGAYGTINPFTATEHQLDAHVGVRLSPEKFYLVFGYAQQTTSYGYPRVGGLGLGITKLPALDRRLSLEGSIVYYPNLNGTCTNPLTCPDAPETVAYSDYRYNAGLTLSLFPQVFIEAGYLGDYRRRKAGFPENGTYSGPFAGLGAHF